MISKSLIEGLEEYRGIGLVIFLLQKLLPFLAFGSLGAFIIYVSYSFIGTEPGQVFLAKLNSYSNLFSAILTFLLVVITGLYTYVSSRVLIQMVEEKESAIRPSLWISVGKPSFVDREYYDGTRKDFSVNVRISNFGRGAAVGVYASYSIPLEWEDANDYPQRIGTSGRKEEFLIQGTSIENKIELMTSLYDIKGTFSGYFNLTLRYEDTERNLYELNKDYYLRHDSSKLGEFYYLYTQNESLYFVAYKDRKYLEDDQELRSSNRVKRIFRRKMQWRMDSYKPRPKNPIATTLDSTGT